DACVARTRVRERPLVAITVLASGAALAFAWLSAGVPARTLGALASALLTAGWFWLRLYRSGSAPLLLAGTLGVHVIALAQLAPTLVAWVMGRLDRLEARLREWRGSRLDAAWSWGGWLLAAALAAPLALSRNASQGDWGGHFYYLVQQVAAFGAGTWPTPFLHAEPYGAFY